MSSDKSLRGIFYSLLNRIKLSLGPSILLSGQPTEIKIGYQSVG